VLATSCLPASPAFTEALHDAEAWSAWPTETEVVHVQIQSSILVNVQLPFPSPVTLSSQR